MIPNYDRLGLAPILDDVKNLGRYRDFNSAHNISHYEIYQNTRGESLDLLPPYTFVTIAYFKAGVNHDKTGYMFHIGSDADYLKNKGWTRVLSRKQAFKKLRQILAKEGIKRRPHMSICHKHC